MRPPPPPVCSLCERAEPVYYQLGPLIVCWRCCFKARQAAGRK